MNRPIPPGTAIEGSASAISSENNTRTNPSSASTPATLPAVGQAARRTCILVLGMHRSGTSALTRVISLLGAELPKEVLGANPTNPTGHWEPQRLIDLHDRMLAEAGSRWDDWRAFDSADLARSRLHFYRAEIARILDEEFGDAPLFVLKEPRLSRFVPLYIDILEAMGVELRFIHTCRNPLAVIASLATRDRFTEPFTSLLWLRHELEAERATRGRARVFVSYEAFVDDWPETLAKVDAALGIEWPRPPAEVASEIDAYLSREHQHHAASEARLHADGRIGTWVKDGYTALRALGANADDAQAELVLERVGAEFDASARMFGDAFYGELSQRQSALAAMERHWRETAAHRAEELARVANETAQSATEAAVLIDRAASEREALHAQLAERDLKLGELGSELERHAAEGSAQSAAIAALAEQQERERAEIQRQLTEKDERIAELARNLDANRAAAVEREARLAEMAGTLDAQRSSSAERDAAFAVERSELTESIETLVQQAAASKIEIAELIAKRTDLERTVEERAKETAALVSQTAELVEESSRLARVSAQLEADLRDKEVARSQLVADLSAAKSAKENTDSAIAKLEGALKDSKANERILREIHTRAVEHIAEIRRSTSWRITRPLRAIREIVRGPNRLATDLRNVLRPAWRRLPLSSSFRLRLLVGARNNVTRMAAGEAPRLIGDQPSPSLSSLFAKGPTDAELIEQSGHFDAVFYAEQAGGTPLENPVLHYCNTGWRAGFDPNHFFSSSGYRESYSDVKKAGVNPFAHYLRHGKVEGRLPNPFASRFRRDRSALQRFGLSEYGNIERVLDFQACPPPPNARPSVCVHLHLFHTDMAAQFAGILNRIRVPFTLLISAPPAYVNLSARRYWTENVDFASSIVIKAVQNRGRDVAPWLIDFAEEIKRHDLFLHVHSKRSSYSSEHAYWLRYLVHTVAGSEGIVNQILGMFHQDERLGIVCPAYAPFLNGQPNFGQTRHIFADLARRLGAKETFADCPDFPAGSFFWARSATLMPLFDLGMNVDDFEPEAGQSCGTLAHAIERVIGLLPRLSGQRLALIAVDVPFEKAEDASLVEDSMSFLSPRADGKVMTRLSPSQIGRAREIAARSPLSVSVVIPTWNRRENVLTSIRSILEQDRQVDEILVCDDGSTDDTLELLRERFPRETESGLLKLLELPHRGVSAARNSGIRAASGDIIFFLDSDNTWTPHHTLLAVCAYELNPEINSTYSALALFAGEAEPEIKFHDYRRDLLISNNFIDLNVFSHRRIAMAERGVFFDENMTRLVDWDYILECTKKDPPLAIPYLAANYFLDRERLGNITLTVPLESNLTRLREHHLAESKYSLALPLVVAIKCPAPSWAEVEAWGDYHFACSLKQALERQGFTVRIDILPEWYGVHTGKDDAVIVLRGLSRYEPSPEHVNIVWNISHPDKVTEDEYQLYDHIFVASLSRGRELRERLGSKASPLLQCSDIHRFQNPGGVEPAVAGKVLFVGNSRGVQRWMPRACIEAGIPVVVYGDGWNGLIPDRFLAGVHIPNNELSRYYSSAAVVLNDHWPDMASKGFISNRVFDAGLSGSYIISDNFSGSDIFSGNIDVCRSSEESKNLVARALDDPSSTREKRRNIQRIIARSHTFDHRANEIAQFIREKAFGRLGISNEIPELQADRHFTIARTSTTATDVKSLSKKPSPAKVG